MNHQASITLHANSIVIDSVCPLVMDDQSYVDWYREGGLTAIAPTVGGWDDCAQTTLNRLAVWHRVLRERSDLVLVRRATDVESVKEEKKLGVYFHIQGTDPVETNLDLIDLYKTLGVGVIQLTYNVKNRVGDGCEERTDAGLSRFGIKLVERLNKARVIVDCSHTGERTSLDAIEHSSAPVVLTHANPKSVHESARNVSNELLGAIAKSGGVIGVAGYPAFVGLAKRPSLDHFIAHIDALVQRVGIDHVGLGIDYYWGQAGVATDEEALKFYREGVRAGRLGSAYPPPPHHYPEGIETPKTLPNLTHRLLERGYREADVRKILGENWLRVMRAVWGS
jgi:membrane dipeptidase